jgi:hypothetical protein
MLITPRTATPTHSHGLRFFGGTGGGNICCGGIPYGAVPAARRTAGR